MQEITNNRNYREISFSQLNEMRETLLERQGGKCAICGSPISHDGEIGNVDHQHCFKGDELGIYGNGLIRGVLCRNCNSLEGKVWNNIHRYGKTSNHEDPVLARVEWLENLLDYYRENYSHISPTLHPKEKRIEKLGKQQYNKIIKFWKTLPQSYKRNGEMKEMPKYTGRWSPKLKELALGMEMQNSRVPQELQNSKESQELQNSHKGKLK